MSGLSQYQVEWNIDPQEGLCSFWTRLFVVLPIMVLAVIETTLYTIIMSGLMVFLPKNHALRKDRRKWPSSYLLFSSGTACKYIKANATTWKALEYLYDWDEHTKHIRGFDRIISNFWNKLENCHSTRNRLRILKYTLYQEIDRLLAINANPIAICSLAAGSARANVEVVANYVCHYPELLDRFRLILVDFDTEAHNFSKQLADKLCPGLSSIITTKKSVISQDPENLSELMNYIRSFDPAIIEMAGFTDYMTKTKAVILFRSIREIMRPGTSFITNNVRPNFERVVLELVVSWKMLNRTEAEMMSIFSEAGFVNVVPVLEATAIQPLYTMRR